MRLYREVLALPGMRRLMVLLFLARIPMTASGMVITLHVAVTLQRSYGGAGLVGTAATLGMAAGAVLNGRVVDRFGLRPMLAVVTVGETLFWLFARDLPYGALLFAAIAGGLLIVPAMSISRQTIAAQVPEHLRRTAYSLDTMSVDIGYIFGPAAAVLVCTRFGTPTAMLGMAVAAAVIGTALFTVNPPMRSEAELAEAEAATGEPPPRRSWLTPQLLAVLALGMGSIFILGSSEVAVVAALRANGELGWTGLVIFAWSAASVVGGLVYGGLRRHPSQPLLLAGLALTTIPVGLASGHWWAMALAILPAGLLCAPNASAVSERVSVLAPPRVRGLAMGLQSAAFTLGIALGAPVVGFVMDRTAPEWGFVASGAGGLVALLLAGRAALRRPVPTAKAAEPERV